MRSRQGIGVRNSKPQTRMYPREPRSTLQQAAEA